MIHLKIQMFSYIELAEQHVWVDKEVQLFFCYLRFSYSTLYSSVLTYSFFWGCCFTIYDDEGAY